MASTIYEIFNDVWDDTNNALKCLVSYVHTHENDANGGTLDWDNIWSDAVHSHASNAEGGTLDHGAITGLTDDDHTQYTRHALSTAASDFLVGSGSNTFIKKTLAETKTLLGLSTTTYKTADETVNNSTTLQNDDHLLFAVAANEVFEFTMVLRTISQGAADIKFAITVPTAATIEWEFIGRDEGATMVQATQIGSGTSVGAYGVATNYIHTIRGIIINSTNAGNVQLQWAQEAADVSDTKVLANSCIIAHKLA